MQHGLANSEATRDYDDEWHDWEPGDETKGPGNGFELYEAQPVATNRDPQARSYGTPSSNGADTGYRDPWGDC